MLKLFRACSLRQTVDLADHLDQSKQSSTQTTSGTSIDHSNSTNKMGQTSNDLSKTSNLSTRRSADLSAHVVVNNPPIFGAKAKALLSAIGVDFGIKASLSGSADKQALYSKAQKTIESEDFQEGLRQLKQDIQNHSFGRTDNESKKMVESINQSLDQANSSREEASKSFRESDDYLKQAAYLQNSATSINANYSHQFKNWLANQPSDNAGGGRLGQRGAAHIIANDPKLATRYAQRFLEEKGLAPWKPSEIVDDPEARAQETYKHESRHVIVPVDKDDALQKMQALKDKGKARGLGPVTDNQGLEDGFAAKDTATTEKIEGQKKTIEQEHAAKAYKHHRESRKSLLPQAAYQEVKHGSDVGTNIVDLVRGDTQGEKKS